MPTRFWPDDLTWTAAMLSLSVDTHNSVPAHLVGRRTRHDRGQGCVVGGVEFAGLQDEVRDSPHRLRPTRRPVGPIHTSASNPLRLFVVLLPPCGSLNGNRTATVPLR